MFGFYANFIIGLDADSFSLYGGTPYYQKASNIVTMMQQSEDKGWAMGDQNNRYALANDVLANMYAPYREAMYEYHIKGLDVMSTDPSQAKTSVANAINMLAGIHRSRPNALLTRIFFDAKSDEIAYAKEIQRAKMNNPYAALTQSEAMLNDEENDFMGNGRIPGSQLPDQIVGVFAAGPSFDKSNLIETLTRINSTNGVKWNRM